MGGVQTHCNVAGSCACSGTLYLLPEQPCTVQIRDTPGVAGLHVMPFRAAQRKLALQLLDSGVL